MIISLIAAMDRRRLIGVENRLPWHLPADLRHFKQVTMGKPILMGRKTFGSLGRPLPGRHNIIVTREPGFVADGCTVVRSVDEALAAGSRHPEVMVIGGASFYAQLLPRTQRMYFTLVDGEFEGDTFFPRYDPTQWREIERRDFDADEENPYPYSFVVLAREGEGTGVSMPRL